MSASLVGSEMCIRDRERPVRQTSRGSTPSELLGRSAQWAAGAARQPVSYTHLTLPTICSV
eukprot:483494-Alexandrium_andersonii.AAC.1